MAQRSQALEFGKWDDGENVPYTTYFDNVTKAKGDRLNPNDPLEGVSDTGRSNYEQHKTREGVVKKLTQSPLRHYAVESPTRVYGGVTKVKLKSQEASGSNHRQDLTSESDDNNLKRRSNSPLNRQTPGRVSFDSPLHQHEVTKTSDSTKRTMRKSTGSSHRIETSPLHPHHHSRPEAKNAGVSSPSWERRGSPHRGSHGLAPLTPGRSRLQPVSRGNEIAGQGATVPRFGDWDENNPGSSENFTGIFAKVREERQSGEGNFPASSTNVADSNSRNPSSDENSKRCCCFWWRK